MAAKNKKMGRGKKIRLGAGISIAVAAAAIAGAYLMSDKGKKSRGKIKGWTLKARGEVLEGLEKLEVINEGAYSRIVEEVGKGYSALKHVDKKELALMMAELRSQWKHMQSEWERAKRRGGKVGARKKKAPRSRRKK